MYKNKFLFILAGLLGFSVLATFGQADDETIVTQKVEKIIDAQQEVKRQEIESRKAEREILSEASDGIRSGREEFLNTCAICHGAGAKGDGLFSRQLTKMPDDLTVIRKKNGGVFPFLKVYEIIDGREGAGIHGSRTMPIWGGRYSAESWFDVSAKHAETVARGKIFELILFLNSIQEN